MFFSPLGLVPKKGSFKFHLIHNQFLLRNNSINDGTPHEFCAVRYKKFDHVVSLLNQVGRGALIAKCDIESAFRVIPISPSEYHLLGFTWQNKYYADCCLPMGCSSSCKIFEDFSSAIQRALHYKFDIPFNSV